MSFNFADYPRLDIPEGRVKQIARKSDGLVLWQAGYINQVPLSIDTDGSIYNGGLGYKDGYRIRSGGAEGASTAATCTGFIKVQGGDVVRISGCDFTWSTGGVNNAINASDSSFVNLGQIPGNTTGYGIFSPEDGAWYSGYGKTTVTEETTGVWKWVVPPAESGVAYIRITACADKYTPASSALIVTINEEIT